MKEKKRLVVFDRETDYAERLVEYIRSKKPALWQTVLYTGSKKLYEDGLRDTDLFLVSEHSYEAGMQTLGYARMIVLNESGFESEEHLLQVEKYIDAEEIYKYILLVYQEFAGDLFLSSARGRRTSFLGVYSPVKRCMQTMFSITLCKQIADRYRCLYVNFESYAANDILYSHEGGRNLGDLLYYLDASKEQFETCFRVLKEQRGNFEYLPPMRNGQDLLCVSPMDWMRFLNRIEQMGEYDYIVMDLSEALQGLFDILRSCETIFTITRQDRISESKILQYEHLLRVGEYTDVWDKTVRCSIPAIKALPEDIEQFTKGDLSEFVEKELEGILGHRGGSERGLCNAQEGMPQGDSGET